MQNNRTMIAKLLSRYTQTEKNKQRDFEEVGLDMKYLLKTIFNS